MKYYFDKGIPYDEWYLSPGRKEESVNNTILYNE